MDRNDAHDTAISDLQTRLADLSTNAKAALFTDLAAISTDLVSNEALLSSLRTAVFARKCKWILCKMPYLLIIFFTVSREFCICVLLCAHLRVNELALN